MQLEIELTGPGPIKVFCVNLFIGSVHGYEQPIRALKTSEAKSHTGNFIAYRISPWVYQSSGSLLTLIISLPISLSKVLLLKVCKCFKTSYAPNAKGRVPVAKVLLLTMKSSLILQMFVLQGQIL